MKAEKLRSPVRWFGGKGNMLGRLAPLVPNGGRPYCEPYCGGASLFFSRDPAPVEVLNDLDGDLVNLFRCLQDRTTFEELRHRIMWTPYARGEFERALDVLQQRDADPVMRAWAFFVTKNQGLTGVIKTAGNWSRAFISSGYISDVTNRWIMRQSMLDAFRMRLMCVQIDNRDALEVISYWDNENAVFYVDPPYVWSTRKSLNVYSHEPDNSHHERLVNVLLSVKGAVVLSGYDTPLYSPLLDAGWTKIEFAATSSTACKTRLTKKSRLPNNMKDVMRVEVVWRNRRCLEMIEEGASNA